MELKKYFVKRQFKEIIDAEEIFLDAEAIRSLERKGKLEKPIKETNFKIAYFIALAGLAILFLRSAYLQVVKGGYYSDLALGNKLRVYSVAAPRGIVYDRFEEPLLRNIPSFDLVVNLADFFNNVPERREAILSQIADVLVKGDEFCRGSVICGGASGSLTDRKLSAQNWMQGKIKEARSSQTRITLFKDIDREAVLVLKTMIGDYQGMQIEDNIKRQYFLGPPFAHILGYTGEMNQEEIKKYSDYALGERVGKDGLEYEYEDVLRGKPGQEQIEVDSMGKTIQVLAARPAQSGQGIVLSIDSELQEKLFTSLTQAIQTSAKSKKAAAVAINPQDGAILALVSLPSFDNNLLVQETDVDKIEALLNDPNQALLNKATSGQYPPGSTVKPLIAAAALEEGIIGPSTRVDCTGLINISSWVYRDWMAHGWTDVKKAIAESCNVFFYTVGGGYGTKEGLGVDKIAQYLRLFGLGRITQIDLPQEKAGFVPDSQWCENSGRTWRLGDTYNLSIGQGDLLATPLQMAVAVAAVANGGTVYQPWLVDRVVNADKETVRDFSPKVIGEGFIGKKNLQTVQEGMREAVLSGSCRALSALEVKTAGKTGTAQFSNNAQTHAWFIGFAPYENPEIGLAVIIEGGGEGHQAAVPVAKEVFEWYFNRDKLEASY